jgi:hypothetical protein
MELTDAESRALARLPLMVRDGLLAQIAGRGWCGDDDGLLHDYDSVPVVIVLPRIDRGIAPLVAALNRLDGVRTVASCAGRPHSLYETRAHVMYHSLGFLAEPVEWWLQRAADTAGVEVAFGACSEIWLQPDDVLPLARALEDAISARLA